MRNELDNRMRVAEIAACVGVTVQTVYGWARSRKNFNWEWSSNRVPTADRREVEEFAAGYMGRRNSQAS